MLTSERVHGVCRISDHTDTATPIIRCMLVSICPPFFIIVGETAGKCLTVLVVIIIKGRIKGRKSVLLCLIFNAFRADGDAEQGTFVQWHAVHPASWPWRDSEPVRKVDFAKGCLPHMMGTHVSHLLLSPYFLASSTGTTRRYEPYPSWSTGSSAG